ncbi:hypothetical protein KM043_018878, partial [Ampulex compressa]
MNDVFRISGALRSYTALLQHAGSVEADFLSEHSRGTKMNDPNISITMESSSSLNKDKTKELKSQSTISNQSRKRRKSPDNFVSRTEFIPTPKHLFIKVSPHPTLNTSRGVITCQDLLNCSVEEITENLKAQGVINVKRIKSRKEGVWHNTASLILTFNTPDIPEKIKAAMYSLP